MLRYVTNELADKCMHVRNRGRQGGKEVKEVGNEREYSEYGNGWKKSVGSKYCCNLLEVGGL
jgi:hypothetical protein